MPHRRHLESARVRDVAMLDIFRPASQSPTEGCFLGGHGRYLLVCIAPVTVCDDLRTPAELAVTMSKIIF